MVLIDHLLALLLAVLGPLRSAVVGLKRFQRADARDLGRVRLKAYRGSMLGQLWRVAAVMVVWWLMHRSPATLGLAPHAGAGLIGVSVGLAVIIVVMLRQRREALADPTGRRELREHLDNIRLVLPHTRAEFKTFAWVALTAGICEELLYRGYLIWYFSHALPWWGAGLVTAVAFGFGHAYQGARGVVVTGLLGAFLAAVYFLTGSLYASMLIHFLMDLHSGDLAWRVYETEAADTLPPAPAVEAITPQEPHVP